MDTTLPHALLNLSFLKGSGKGRKRNKQPDIREKKKIVAQTRERLSTKTATEGKLRWPDMKIELSVWGNGRRYIRKCEDLGKVTAEEKEMQDSCRGAK